MNKLKKRDAEASPHPLSLLCCWQLVLPPFSSFFFSWKWWTFQVLELVEGLYITPFHSMLAFWVLPQRGEIPWAGKLSSWTINHGLELIFDSKLWWGTLNRAGLPADTWIESLKVQHARRRGDEGLFVFSGPAKSSWKPNWSKSGGKKLNRHIWRIIRLDLQLCITYVYSNYSCVFILFDSAQFLRWLVFEYHLNTLGAVLHIVTHTSTKKRCEE